MIWRFTLHIKGIAEFSDSVTDSLFDAGCDDATLSSSAGAAKISFDREAVNLEHAIQTAVAAVHRVGLSIDRLEIDERDLLWAA